MKKIINNPIFTFILGALIFGVAGVSAYTMLANSISYTPKNSAWKVNNVEDALDSLYISKTADNYSTEEKIVGTWIDGKPIYQRTWTGLSISLSANVWYNTGIDATNCTPVGGIAYAEGTTDNFISYPNIRAVNSKWNLMYPQSINTFTTLTIQYTKTTDIASPTSN